MFEVGNRDYSIRKILSLGAFYLSIVGFSAQGMADEEVIGNPPSSGGGTPPPGGAVEVPSPPVQSPIQEAPGDGRPEGPGDDYAEPEPEELVVTGVRATIPEQVVTAGVKQRLGWTNFIEYPDLYSSDSDHPENVCRTIERNYETEYKKCKNGVQNTHVTMTQSCGSNAGLEDSWTLTLSAIAGIEYTFDHSNIDPRFCSAMSDAIRDYSLSLCNYALTAARNNYLNEHCSHYNI